MLQIESLLSLLREDLGGTYRTWFHRRERLGNFNAIRRGLCELCGPVEIFWFLQAFLIEKPTRAPREAITVIVIRTSKLCIVTSCLGVFDAYRRVLLSSR
jgi:hypothetical protein